MIWGHTLIINSMSVLVLHHYASYFSLSGVINTCFQKTTFTKIFGWRMQMVTSWSRTQLQRLVSDWI